MHTGEPPSTTRLPHGTVSPKLVRAYTTLSRIGGVIVAVAGITVLIGWMLGRDDLVGLADEDAMRAMQPLSATVFVLVGVSIVLSSRARTTRVRRMTARIAGLLAFLAGVVVLIEHTAGVDTGVDRALFPNRLVDAGLSGQPTAVAATVFTFLGAASVLVTAVRSVVVGIGQVLAMAATALGGVVGIAVFYGAGADSGFPFGMHATSVGASVLTITAGLAITLAVPDRGLMGPLAQEGPGGSILRRVLPVVLLLPVAALAFIVRDVSTGELSEPRALAVVAIVVTVALVALALFAGHQIDELERRRWHAVESAIRAEETVAQNARIVTLLGEALRPPIDVGTGGVEIDSWYAPALGVASGDAIEVVRLGPQRVGLVVVDATGHGAEPAVMALGVKNALVQGLLIGLSPAEDVDAAWRRLRPESGATAVVMVLDRTTGGGVAVNAGHPPVLRIGREGEVSRLGATGPVLHPGLEAQWTEQRFALEDGDLIAVHTDGLADPVDDARGGISVERLISVMSEHRAEDLAEIVDALANTVSRYAPDRLRDDAALVLLRYGGFAPRPPETAPHDDVVPASFASEGDVRGLTGLPPSQQPR